MYQTDQCAQKVGFPRSVHIFCYSYTVQEFFNSINQLFFYSRFLHTADVLLFTRARDFRSGCSQATQQVFATRLLHGPLRTSYNRWTCALDCCQPLTDVHQGTPFRGKEAMFCQVRQCGERHP